MQTPDELLAALRQVRSLRFEASSDAGTGWQGNGAGTVETSEPSANLLVFVESGEWRPSAAGRAAIKFGNVYRWSALGVVLRLEHLRFGPSAPVLLFDMAPGPDGHWREVSPHQCKEDCYSASLRVEDGQVLLAWTVVGPQKRESIRYTYW
jgi:hypothetical protein